jgi:hypothetical protein
MRNIKPMANYNNAQLKAQNKPLKSNIEPMKKFKRHSTNGRFWHSKKDKLFYFLHFPTEKRTDADSTD